MDKIEERITKLKSELEKGNQALNQKQQEINTLTSTMFRIQGAIQVLEELQKEGQKE